MTQVIDKFKIKLAMRYRKIGIINLSSSSLLEDAKVSSVKPQGTVAAIEGCVLRL